MIYCCLSIILMKPKQGFIFHVLLFFVRTAGKELVKVSLISALHRLHCHLSETPDTSKTTQTGNLGNRNSCEIDHWAVERRWVVIPKGLVVKGLWGKERHSGRTRWRMLWAAEPCGCPGHPDGRASPARAWAELSALGPPLVEKNLLLMTTKEREKRGECPDRLHPQGFPEGLTQTSLQAPPFPPSLVETFILVPWTHPPKVHTISEYTPIYSLLLQRHLTVRGCFPLTPAKCGIEVWGWGDGSYLSE